MRHLVALAAIAWLGASTAHAQQAQTSDRGVRQAQADAALERWTTDELQGFASEAEFGEFLRDLRTAQRARYGSARGPRIRFAQSQAGAQSDAPPEPVCPAEDPECTGHPDRRSSEGGGSIVVTGSMVRPQPITNNQEAGVDEGDIVKQIGPYLLVLQDGRIFSIDTRGGRGRRLRLVDRADVYRDPSSDAWYDELVVHDDRVIVTGYTYSGRASEIAVFRVGRDGRLAPQGAFRIESEDYYSVENYSTRIAGDRLILYTPVDLEEGETDAPLRWPRLRRWVGEGAGRAAGPGQQLLDARRVHRPLVTSRRAVLHSISICPLGPVSAGRDLSCRTTGFIAGPNRTLYVSPTAAFLWTAVSRFDDDYGDRGVPDCRPGEQPPLAETPRATVYRLPLGGAPPEVIGARGQPADQLGLDASNGRFRALVVQPSERCEHQKSLPLAYFSVAERDFARRRVEAPANAFTAMPDIGAGTVENRFSDTHLVFGGRSNWRSTPSSFGGGVVGATRIAVVPLADPARVELLQVPHNVIRAERVGNDFLLTGYRNEDGLSLSLIRPDATSKVSSTLLLPGRYEGEGRSHAFNAQVEEDGSAIVGLPTVLRPQDARRYWWRSGASDVGFATFDAEGRLAGAGALHSSREEGDERPDFESEPAPNGYRCEVSCIDWYGNTRPIFTDGRIFALTGTELVEGRIDRYESRVEEVQRLNLTAPVGSGGEAAEQ